MSNTSGTISGGSSVDSVNSNKRGPVRIGLTGSIGMGKSTITNQLKHLGFPVFDADAEVHRLYSPLGAAVEPLRNIFPDAVAADGSVNRTALMEKVLTNSNAIKLIESVVHPLVTQARQEFFKQAAREGHFLVVFDIPLLFENRAAKATAAAATAIEETISVSTTQTTKATATQAQPEASVDDFFDYTIVVTAAASVQRERVLQRPGMTARKFESILAKQVPDAEKRALADFVIHTDYSSGFAEGKAQLAKIIEDVIEKENERWQCWKNRQLVVAAGSEDITISSPSSNSNGTKSNNNGTNSIESISHSNNNSNSNNNIRNNYSNNNNNSSTCSKTDVHITPISLRAAIDLIVFDLDDTLVPTMQPIKSAMAALDEFMRLNMPHSSRTDPKQLWDITKSVQQEQPLVCHDLTELRRRVMRAVAQQHGEESLVEDALMLFVKERSQVSAHLFSDVLPFLQSLKSQGFQLGVFTNGNADISNCAVLSPYFSLLLGGAEVGASKPSPVGFMACSQKTGVVPSRILYVGDSYEKDIVGAKNCGMLTALLLREDRCDCDRQETTTTTTTNSATGTTTINATTISTTTAAAVAKVTADEFPAADLILDRLNIDEVNTRFQQLIQQQTKK